MWTNGAPTIGTPRPAASPTGGVWNNAGPQINVQRAAPQPYQNPQQSRDQYALRTALSASYAPPPQYQYARAPVQQSGTYNPDAENAFTFGQGGTSGNGQISFRDHAQIDAALSKQIYEAAYAKAQRGEFPMGWQLENLRYAASNAANEAATGRSASWLTRPTFEPQWAQYNEAANNLHYLGRDFDLEAALPWQLKGQNTGEMMKPIFLSPAGTAFGGGDGGGDAWGTAMPAPQVASSSMPSYDHTQNRTYNNGDLRSAHDYGSYNSPLLRSGAGDHFAVANISPRAAQGQYGAPIPMPSVSGKLLPPGYSGLRPQTPTMDPRYVRPHSDWDEGPAPNNAPPRPGDIRTGAGGQMWQLNNQGQWNLTDARTAGAETLPWQYAMMPSVGMSSSREPSATQVRAESVGRYVSEANAGLRDLSSYLKDVYYAQPVASRAKAMSANQGVFGGYEF